MPSYVPMVYAHLLGNLRKCHRGYRAQILGHKYVTSTQKYINAAKAYADAVYHEHESRIATTKEKASKLIDVGFEYHMEIDGCKIFRRKKPYNG
jgi:hypothetical protein